MSEDILDRALPKWPQMLAHGDPVSAAQAMEIIRRTDSFFISHFGGGNDKEWDRAARAAISMPHEPTGTEGMREFFEKWDAWVEAWGGIQTEYVHNSWVSCAYLYGPHGWCSPDGQIGHVDNIGKWPSGKEVYADWVKLAAAFPFLRISVVLTDREHSEPGSVPVIGMRIEDGHVRVFDPALPENKEILPGGRGRKEGSAFDRNLTSALNALALGPRLREHGISMEQVRRWGEEFIARKKVDA